MKHILKFQLLLIFIGIKAIAQPAFQEFQCDDCDSHLRFHDPNSAWFSMGIDFTDGRKYKLNYGGTVGENNHFVMTSDGKVGIGLNAPAGALDVNNVFYTGTGTLIIRNQDYVSEGGELILQGTPNHNPWSLDNLIGDFRLHHSGTEYFRVRSNGNVGIGSQNPDARLTVNGKIKAKEIEVTTNIPADYVFEEDYALKSLEEVEAYVKEYKHLPGIPSAKEIKEQGWQVGEMSNKLLEKVEELTLHLIEQNKKIEAFKATIESQQEEITRLKAILNK